MSARFEELDWRSTPLGELSLRRRWDPLFGKDVYEIKLDDDFLMSSQFTVAEEEMARLALAKVPGDAGPLDVVVAGLGLGYTAQAALADPRVRSLLVVEALGEVIEWHDQGLIPAPVTPGADPRCRVVQGDFFRMVATGPGFDPAEAGRRFHAVVVDIDHSPQHLLHPDHAGFYRPAGLRSLAAALHPGGVFALWSNDPPEEAFLATLASVFAEAEAETVRFPNPIQGGSSANTVYLATTGADATRK
ncbi:MAG: spermidine synthase [Micromonosporaceae bacterium]|nr:spermidine synthase [Micromonosporaceae bacterium]